MRLSFCRTLAAVSVAAVLAPAAFATNFWVGFDYTRTKKVTQGGVKGILYYVDALVGSNEPDTTTNSHVFVVNLQGAGPAGACFVLKEGAARLAQPVDWVRFQIFYPNPKPPRDPRDLAAESVIPVDYTLKAYTTGEFQVSNQVVRKFRRGGTVSCVRCQGDCRTDP